MNNEVEVNLVNAKEEFMNSVKVLRESSINLVKAQVASKEAKLMSIGTSAINSYKRLSTECKIFKFDEEIAKLKSDKEKMLSMLSNNVLNFKKGAILKIDSKKSKLITVGSSLVSKVKKIKDLNGKIKDTLNQAKNYGIEKANNTLNAIIELSDLLNEQAKKVDEFTGKQIDRYMDFKKNLKQKKNDSLLNFKDNAFFKTNSLKSKIGRINTEAINKIKLSSNNLDLKIQIALLQAENYTIEQLTDIINNLNNDYEKLNEFTSDKIDKYMKKRDELKKKREDKVAEIKDKGKVRIEQLKIKKDKLENSVINFKLGVAGRVTTLKSRLGRVRTDLVKNVKKKSSEINNKINNLLNNVKDKYYTYEADKALKSEEKQKEADYRRAEKLAENKLAEERKINLEEHKKGFQEIIQKQKQEEKKMEREKQLEQLKMLKDKLETNKKLYKDAQSGMAYNFANTSAGRSR